MKKSFVFVLLIGVIIAAAVWFANNKENNSSLPPTATNANVSTDSAAPPAKTLVAQAVYNCDSGKMIRAEFYKGEQIAAAPGQPPVPTGSAKIVLSDGRNFDLPQTISADGGRYANSDESFVFWSKGEGALVLEGGAEKNYKNCMAVKAASACVDGKFTNLEGGYSFDCFPEWNFAITKRDNPKTDSLFGLGATEIAGSGGVEVREGFKSIADFLDATGATITDKKNIAAGGAAGIRAHYAGFPQKGEQAVFYKDGKIFNIYLGTDSKGSELGAADIGFFDRIVNSFKFVSE